MKEFDWESFEADQEDFDRRYLEAACDNTYLILTGKAKLEDMLEKESMQGGSVDQYIETAILFNPFKDDYNAKFPHLHNEVSRIELVDFLIEHYIETEEYEKCADLTKYKKKLC
tara:strand:- start:3174 stop:3515 length:342 start_codon:yes stop_codon:yes gene_type:complete